MFDFLDSFSRSDVLYSSVFFSGLTLFGLFFLFVNFKLLKKSVRPEGFGLALAWTFVPLILIALSLGAGEWRRSHRQAVVPTADNPLVKTVEWSR